MMIEQSLLGTNKVYRNFVFFYLGNHNKDLYSIEFMDANNILLDKQFAENVPDKKQIIGTDNYKIMRLCLKKGVEVPPHGGTHTAFFLVLEGRGIFTKGSEEIELKQNDFLFFKVDEIRGIKSLEDLVILAVRD